MQTIEFVAAPARFAQAPRRRSARTTAVFTPRFASNSRAEKRQRIPLSWLPLSARVGQRAARYFTLRHLTLHRFDLLLGTVGVVVRTEKMQGDIRLVADHPAVVSRRDVEDVSLVQLGNGAVVHCSRRAPRDNDADMLNRAARRAGSGADMRRPSPARLVDRAADRHAAYPNNLELALLKRANFVRLLEPLQHHIHVLSHP
jgi:hypothetical protein